MSKVAKLSAALNPKALTIDILKGKETHYQVDLERCDTSAQVLDWIIQVSEKRWATDELVGQVVRLLDRALRPQENLCSQGHEQGPINVPALVKKNLARKAS